MKIKLKRLSIILTLCIAVPGMLCSQGDTALTLTGKIADQAGTGLKNARVAVTVMSLEKNGGKTALDKSCDSLKPMYAAYSGMSGKWKIDVPDCKTFMINVSANGYDPAERIISITPGNTKPGDVNFGLKETLGNIIYGSIEHLQLYVYPLHQRRLEALISTGNIDPAAAFIENKIKDDIRKYAYAFAGYLMFDYAHYDEAKTFFERAGSKLWFNLMGHRQLKQAHYNKALTYLSQGVATKKKADDLYLLAKTFEKSGDKENATACYRLALTDYSTLLKSFKYRWDADYISKSILCEKKLAMVSDSPEEAQANRMELKTLLEKAGEYCKKLNEVAIYYFCHEEKRDRVFLVRRLDKARGNPPAFFKKFSPIKIRGRKIVDYFKYDLQFIKKENGVITENRKLLFENLDNSNPGIPVLSYSIQKPLHGPHTLVGSGWQGLFDYKITGEENLFNEETVIIEATPKWNGDINKMFGKVWLHKENGSVLKIEWHHRRVQNKHEIRARGLILDREPELKFISEFGLKRSGLRFPSRCSIIESYYHEVEKPFVRLRIDIDYLDYQFFMVGTTVETDQDNN